MQTAPAEPLPRRDYLTIALLMISGLGMVLALLGSGLTALFGLIGLFSESTDIGDVTPLFIVAWVGLLAAALAVPSLVYSIQKLLGQVRRAPQASGYRLASISMVLWPFVLLLGRLLSESRLAWLVFPPLQVLAVGLPVWWLVEFARRRLQDGSRQRFWGLTSASMFVTLPAVVMIELLIFGIIVGVIVVWASSQPEVVAELERLAARLMSSQANPDAILEILRPSLQSPLVVFGSLALLGVLVPLLEELLKPLAMWALVGRRIASAEGFVAGAVCGASFALLESLLGLTGPGEGWLGLVVGRSGTALLHITTTALVGWGLASAWVSGKYRSMGLSYLSAVALHGLWNILSLLTGFSVLLENPPQDMRFVAGLAQAAPFGLAIMVLLLFMLLEGSNRRLRRSAVDQPTPAACEIVEQSQ